MDGDIKALDNLSLALIDAAQQCQHFEGLIHVKCPIKAVTSAPKPL
jgi:hypothetical protein